MGQFRHRGDAKIGGGIPIKKTGKISGDNDTFDYTQSSKNLKSKYHDDIVVLGDKSKSERRKQKRATKKNKKQLKRLGLSQTKY